ncbi:MAG: energy transducer TonB [Burkholderiales bacterium]
MNAPALHRDPFSPQPLAGRGFGVALTLLAHGLLLLALTLAVNWRVSTPSPVEAELWAAVPRAAPPEEVQPPPPPAEPPKPVVKPPEPRVEPQPSRAEQDAQIATEKAKREKEREEAEKKRKEEEKKLAEKKAELERREKTERENKQKEKEAQLAREEAQRKQHLERIMKDANKQTPGPSATEFGADYAGQIQKRIRDNTDFPANVEGNRAAEVEIRVTADGRILGQRILKSSGNPAFDEAILRGVERAGTMPRNRNGVAPSPIIATITARE